MSNISIKFETSYRVVDKTRQGHMMSTGRLCEVTILVHIFDIFNLYFLSHFFSLEFDFSTVQWSIRISERNHHELWNVLRNSMENLVFFYQTLEILLQQNMIDYFSFMYSYYSLNCSLFSNITFSISMILVCWQNHDWNDFKYVVRA